MRKFIIKNKNPSVYGTCLYLVGYYKRCTAVYSDVLTPLRIPCVHGMCVNTLLGIYLSL